jgi:hypothetical protein
MPLFHQHILGSVTRMIWIWHFKMVFLRLPNCRHASSMVKDIVTSFLRGSPKRMSLFTSLHDKKAPRLRPLCSTMWTTCICRVNTLLANYQSVVEFLVEQRTARNDYGAQSSGCLWQLLDFRMFFTLRCLHLVFDGWKQHQRPYKVAKFVNDWRQRFYLHCHTWVRTATHWWEV